MKKPAFSIVIMVKNLNVCKAFYRDILELGDPVLDSTFMVEFKIGDSFSLILEKSFQENVSLFSAVGRTSWLFSGGNAEKIRKKMHICGYPVPQSACVDKAGKAFYRFTDPEGNLFYVASQNDGD